MHYHIVYWTRLVLDTTRYTINYKNNIVQGAQMYYFLQGNNFFNISAWVKSDNILDYLTSKWSSLSLLVIENLQNSRQI